MYQYRQIILQMRAGETDRSIARNRLAGRVKARQIRELALSQGWLERATPLPSNEVLAVHFNPLVQPVTQPSQASAYEAQLKQWHADGIQATTMHRALVQQYGYTGSYNSVQRFVKKLKSQSTDSLTVPLHFEPGEAAQVDFGQGPTLVENGKPLKTWFFIMTLCWSRHQYAELVTDQRIETWLGCHRRAFEWFNGVPKKIIIDNPKCAITKACIYHPTIQRSYYTQAEEVGFIISPCPPGDPQKKGRVESGVKYVKKNFMPLRDFRDLSDANQQLKSWVLTEAGHRTHGSTFKQPLQQFNSIEQSLLKPLPEVFPETIRWEKVKAYSNCHVRFEKNYYSLPHQYAHQAVWLSASERLIKIYIDESLVATHARCYGAGEHITLTEHLPPNAQYFFTRDAAWCREHAAHIGVACAEVINTLLDDKVVDHVRATQSVLRLKDCYGATRLEKACQRALYFQSVDCKVIKRILQKGLDQEVLQSDADFDTLADVYRGNSKYLAAPSKQSH